MALPENPFSARKLYLGAAYYPEHWHEERWSEDIRLMQRLRINVVRMAEFAWSTIEPEEGRFELDWLERVIEQLGRVGIETVLGTPTAAPPAWLVAKYPGSLAVTDQGRRVQFGNRCHYCYTSPEFHQASQRIVSAMAERFGPNKHVIGWQFDNEYNRVCYCERCQRSFQEFLQEQYATLESLNEHWSTAYWSQTYSDWSQIPIPIGGHNPGLMLAFKRFITQSYRRFQKLQLDALRPHLPPDVWVTHNFMGWFEGYDHYSMTRDLDIASWDWYVGSGHHNYLKTGAVHDLTRGFKQRNFWVMETQPGNVNWSGVNNVLDKGEARAMAYHAVAHGAEAILYWQWRSALNGQEQYHGTLVDQSGQPRPFFEEVQQIGKEFTQISSLITESAPQAKVAMINDYESRWSIHWQRHHKDFDYLAHFNHYYQVAAKCNVPVDILGAGTLIDPAQLAKYRLVIVPALLIITDELAKILINFVEHGGHLVLTLRSGMKDVHNALLPIRQPGTLAQAAGVEVEDYYALDTPVPVKGRVLEGHSQLWAERLRPLEPRLISIMAAYGKSNGWLDDQPAITVRSYRSGLIYYVGCYLDDAAQQVLVERFFEMARIKMINTPAGIELRARTTLAGQEVYFMINHLPERQKFKLPWRVYEFLTDQEMGEEWDFPGYGVAVFTLL